MHSLFNMDSPLMNGLGKIFDTILLSLCWISGCLPIVTIGTSCGALYRTVYRCLRKDDGYPLKTFWDTYYPTNLAFTAGLAGGGQKEALFPQSVSLCPLSQRSVLK